MKIEEVVDVLGRTDELDAFREDPRAGAFAQGGKFKEQHLH